MTRLALFDLDNTLLTGDSEVLWVDYLLARGALDASFAARNAEMDRRYATGTATPGEFCAFYASTFGGRTPTAWAPVREAFMAEVIRPRLSMAAHALVAQHRAQGDLLVLTTAASRYLSEPSAQALGIGHLIATEMRQLDDGRFAGENTGVLNMREGKRTRLEAWLAARGETPDTAAALLAGATFYSDSANDLPLLRAVGYPVAVDPDPQLLAAALAHRWPVCRLPRTLAAQDA